MQYFAFLVLAAVCSALLTWAVRNLANHNGLVFVANSDRHIHVHPIPRLGGIAIFITFAVMVVLYFSGTPWLHGPVSKNLVHIMPAAAFMFVVGLIDDWRGLRPLTKLLAQVAGGLWLYLQGMAFIDFGFLHAYPLLAAGLSLLCTVGWVVLICNAINLIDGLDGLAAGAALFSMISIFAVALAAGRPGIATAVATLAGSVFGFLIFNFNPASIFLGDSGSLFLGFTLSALVMAESGHQHRLESFVVPVISFALPLTDTIISILRRFMSGHSLFGADREHIHHKLLEMGLTQRQVVTILYVCSAVCATVSVFMLYGSRIALVPLAGIAVLGLFFALRKLGYREFEEFQRIAMRALAQRKVFARNIAVRKAVDHLKRVTTAAQIPALLQKCLQSDFNGFEITLYRNARRGSEIPAEYLSAQWKDNVGGRVVVSMDLTAPLLGVMGEFSLTRGSTSELLIDHELLVGELRIALGIAIQNIVTPRQPVLVRMEEPLPGFGGSLFGSRAGRIGLWLSELADRNHNVRK